MHIQIRPVMAAPPWHYHALFSTSLTIIIVAPIYHQPADYDLSFSKLSFCTKPIVSPPRHFFQICPQRFQDLGAFGLKYAFLRPLSMTVCHAPHTCNATSWHAMSWHVMSCHVMSCHVLTDDWCNVRHAVRHFQPYQPSSATGMKWMWYGDSSKSNIHARNYLTK